MLKTVAGILVVGSQWRGALGLPCPNLCNQHGTCDLVDRECRCHSGYEGADCSRRVCPTGKSWADVAEGTDDAHNTATCSDMGLCDYITGRFAFCLCQCFPLDSNVS